MFAQLTFLSRILLIGLASGSLWTVAISILFWAFSGASVLFFDILLAMFPYGLSTFLVVTIVVEAVYKCLSVKNNIIPPEKVQPREGDIKDRAA